MSPAEVTFPPLPQPKLVLDYSRRGRKVGAGEEGKMEGEKTRVEKEL